VYQTKLTPFKISDQEKFDGILFFSPSAVESYLTNNKIKNEICFCVGTTTAKTLETYKIKNVVIAEMPTIEEVIVEVITYYSSPLGPESAIEEGSDLNKI
jgi:uroporphyrinogen-III synthase